MASNWKTLSAERPRVARAAKSTPQAAKSMPQAAKGASQADKSVDILRAGKAALQAGMSNSYLSPKLQARGFPHKGGMGVYARKAIGKGELLLVWGGVIRDDKQLRKLPKELQQHSIQVEEDLYQVSTHAYDPPDFVNHSCNPNAGLSGQIAVVAMRDIAQGEEICIDYAMCDGSPYDEFECGCGEQTCRGIVTGNDWSRPELWRRYAGYFSPYLQRRIDALRAQQRRAKGSRAKQTPAQEN
jgi:hypothetical protein